MKKLICAITVLTLLFSTVFCITTFAANPSASLTGPGTLRAGDKITLTFKLNGTGVYGFQGELSYNSSQLTLSGTSQKIASPWVVEFTGNTFVAYDNNLSTPINSNKAIFTVTFTVKNVAAGTNIKVSCTEVKASVGEKQEITNVGTVSYNKTVSAPLSTNTNLKSLTVDNATISPAFSAAKTSYTASVPFSVLRLNISAIAEDGKSSVKINSPNLTAGGTTKATVTVTAESGAKKTYTITVTRESDPNYVASGENRLSAITVNEYKLSPIFQSDVKNYLVWLPYETESIKVSGTAIDSKASVEVVGGENLAAGQDNTVTLICTAENGEKTEYTIIAKRAAAHDGSIDAPPQEPVVEDITLIEPESEKSGVAFWWLIVVGVASMLVGALLTIIIFEGLKRKNAQNHKHTKRYY